MVKIEDNFLFHMFQAILYIHYLKILKLWEGVEWSLANITLIGTKVQNYPKLQGKRTKFIPSRDDLTFQHITQSCSYTNLPAFEIILPS